MRGMMMKLGGSSYNGEPEFYSELKDKPNFSAGDEVTAKVKIKSVTESVTDDGKKCWSYEACVVELGGKETEKEGSEEMDEDDIIESGLDEALKPKKADKKETEKRKIAEES